MQITDKAYKKHRVFIELNQYADFYQQLSMSVFQFVTVGTNAFSNIDSYVYSSMHGTLQSIRTLLVNGRINDAYSLLRKYYDSAIINIYSNLYLRNNFSIDNFVVKQIDCWLKGTERLPEYRIMSRYIKSAEQLKPINEAINADDRYKQLRERCNDHTHYNFFHNVLLNDNEVYIKARGKWLERFSEDIKDVFILHLGYLFFLNDYYMRSSDYQDALECNIEPDEDSIYWVAPYIQDIFNDVISPHRTDITNAIKISSSMQLL